MELPDLEGEEKEAALQMLRANEGIFQESSSELGCTNVGSGKIELKDETPFMSKPYRIPQTQRKIMKDCLNDMLEKGVIEPSTTPYTSPCFLVPKANGTGHRLVVDYRFLNTRLRDQSVYPLPNIQELFSSIGQPTFFSILGEF